jgi:hypothetical protein
MKPDGNKRCDNIDWLPKFRANYVFTPISTVINAFAVRGMAMLSELAAATGRPEMSARLEAQSTRTKDAMMALMFDSSAQVREAPSAVDPSAVES